MGLEKAKYKKNKKYVYHFVDLATELLFLYDNHDSNSIPKKKD